MEERERHMETNPQYVPIMRSGLYDFKHTARDLPSTIFSYMARDKMMKEGFANQTLLDVNGADKIGDYKEGLTQFYASGRAEFRLEIHNGLLCQEGKTFDSSKLHAHGKSGYVAFTLNANGELSVFEHLGGFSDEKSRSLAHSSMNAGSPVLAAGEMEIKNGKVIAINTFSGHYKPSLFSVARFLNYLNARSVDISNTKVLMQTPPKPESGLTSEIETVRVGESSQEWHKVSAVDLMNQVEKVIAGNVKSMNEYLNSNQTKMRQVLQVRSTKAKVLLAKEFKAELDALFVELNVSSLSSKSEITEALDKIEQLVDQYEEKHMEIKEGGRLGSKFSQMKEELQEVKRDISKQEESAAQEVREGLKKSF